MRYLSIIAFAMGYAVSTPVLAQQHPEPAQHAPSAGHAPAFHPTPTSHSAHPYPATHHNVTHHTYHHVVHHTSTHHVVRAATHRPAAVARLRRNIVAVHRFHAGDYRAPPGYHYRRWVFGERLPSIYFGSDYWLTDFLAFGLFAPPDGYIWVRYGPDAILIDQMTGEIIQVDYGVFY